PGKSAACRSCPSFCPRFLRYPNPLLPEAEDTPGRFLPQRFHPRKRWPLSLSAALLSSLFSFSVLGPCLYLRENSSRKYSSTVSVTSSRYRISLAYTGSSVIISSTSSIRSRSSSTRLLTVQAYTVLPSWCTASRSLRFTKDERMLTAS